MPDSPVMPVDRPVVNPALRASPRFRRFWVARLLSHTAQNAILLGLLVTVVNRTGSTIHSSLLVLTFVAPAAIFGVAGGVVADRIPKRELLLTAGLLRTALCLLFLHGDSGVAAIYATNLGLSVITQFASPAEAAALPAVVLEHQFVAATAALNLETVLSQLLGTVLIAPLLVRTVGLRPLFMLTALAFFVASIIYANIPGINGREEQHARGTEGALSSRTATGLREAVSESWRLVRSDREVFVSVVVQTLVATTVVVLVSIVPIYTRRVLHLPAEYSVAVFSPAAAGMFLSVRLVPRLVRRYAKSQLASIGFAVFVLGLVLLGFERELSLLLMRHDPAGLLGLRLPHAIYSRVALTAVIAGPLGFAYGVVIVVARAILYDRVPAEMQGRVFAFQGVLGSLASILPLILVGLVAYWLGPRAVLLLVAAVNVAVAWYALRLVPSQGAASSHPIASSAAAEGSR